MWWKACVQWFRKHSKKQKILIAAVIAIAFTLFFPIVSSISGRRFGSSVGVAVGSFHAITEDMPAAYHQGIEDGLSAEDVRTDIGVRLREIGKLNVLAANAELSDIHKVGDTYAAIYTLGADVVFSVDLTEAEVFTNSGEKELIIRLPRPVAQINIDSTRTRLEDEWSRILFDGKTEHGIEEYINSMKNHSIRTKRYR